MRMIATIVTTILLYTDVGTYQNGMRACTYPGAQTCIFSKVFRSKLDLSMRCRIRTKTITVNCTGMLRSVSSPVFRY